MGTRARAASKRPAGEVASGTLVQPARDAEAPSGAQPEGGHVGAKVATSIGIVAATVLAVLLNVLVARHYRRWDLTTGGLYTLSPATVETLRALEEPVKVHVLLSSGDPLEISARHLLQAYRAETMRLEVDFLDPDRRPAELLALQKRYGIEAGETKDGRIVTDASIIVVKGDRPYFITPRDLVEVDDPEDLRARPKLEEALTTAIVAVSSNDRPKVCFTTGHGEVELDVGGGKGLAPLRDRLLKSNFEIVPLPPMRGTPEDAGGPSLADCRLLIVAGPTERIRPEEVARYRAYVEAGGSALVAACSADERSDTEYVRLGLDELLAVAGVALRRDVVFELDPARRSTRGQGEVFMPAAKPHPITSGFLGEGGGPPGIVMAIASSLAPTGAGQAAPVPLLVTSDEAFGMTDFFGWGKRGGPATAGPLDHEGPLTVAYAAELPARARAAGSPAGGAAARGPRIVVIGARSMLFGANFRDDGRGEDLRGSAAFVDGAIAWLSARPPLVAVPKKPAFQAGLRLSEDALASIFRYVVVFIPFAAALLGAAVHLRRLRTERRGALPEEQP